MFNPFKQLRSLGILGINRRNAEFTIGHNPRHLYPLVDDKLRTKELAKQAGIAVPPLYAVIEIERQARQLPKMLGDIQDFVLKPARGSGGSGVIVIVQRTPSGYRRANGQIVSDQVLNHHISNTLSGMYSLAGQPDKVMVEYRVQPSAFIRSFCKEGVPDFRVVVYKGVPAMAMMRLPTPASDGRANLHQGAIGIGIDIATGTMLGGVWHNDFITEDPFTGQPLARHKIPQWTQLLELAAHCQAISGLGYLGVDIVLDEHKGPLILELNARPGLNIQLANRTGLLPRLRKVDSHCPTGLSATEKVRWAQTRF